MTENSTKPAPTTAVEEPRPGPRARGWVGVAVAFVVVLIVAAAGLAVGRGGSSPAAGVAPTAASSAAVPAVPEPFDYQLTLKVISQQCFGTAGCVFVVEPEVAWVGQAEQPTDGSYDLTYTITGDKSGPVIGTVTISRARYIARRVVLQTDTPDLPTIEATAVSRS